MTRPQTAALLRSATGPVDLAAEEAVADRLAELSAALAPSKARRPWTPSRAAA